MLMLTVARCRIAPIGATVADVGRGQRAPSKRGAPGCCIAPGSPTLAGARMRLVVRKGGPMSTAKNPKKAAAKKQAAKKAAPAGKGPIAKDSPKGKVGGMMLEGTHTFEQIAKKIGTTTSNARQHAKQLK